MNTEQPLHLAYRPETFEDMYGNEATVKALQTTLARSNRPHAYLFDGPSGCGKTTLARIVKEEVGCADADFKEIDIADFSGVDTARQVRRQMSMKPMAGDSRVYLLDEVHQLSKQGQNALLKALEDTPSHVYIILATTDPQKLIKTIMTRCTRFTVKPLTNREMTELLEDVAKSEGFKVPKDAIKRIVEVSDGSPRKGLVALDKISSLDDDQMAEAVEGMEEDDVKLSALYGAILKGQWAGVATILKGLKEQEMDAESIRRYLLACSSGQLLNKANAKAFAVLDACQEPTYDTGFPGIVHACFVAVHGE